MALLGSSTLEQPVIFVLLLTACVFVQSWFKRLLYGYYEAADARKVRSQHAPCFSPAGRRLMMSLFGQTKMLSIISPTLTRS